MFLIFDIKCATLYQIYNQVSVWFIILYDKRLLS